MGFTLIEIMVTLCVVTILTTVAIPGFRKTMRDFKMNAFVEDFTDLVKGYRAYYLIFNEWPPDVGTNVLPAGNIRYLVSGRLQNTSGAIITRPLHNRNYSWDYENWITNDNQKTDAKIIELVNKSSTKTVRKVNVAVNVRDMNTFDLNDCIIHLAGLDFFANSAYRLESKYIVYVFPEAEPTSKENRYF